MSLNPQIVIKDDLLSFQETLRRLRFGNPFLLSLSGFYGIITVYRSYGDFYCPCHDFTFSFVKFPLVTRSSDYTINLVVIIVFNSVISINVINIY